MFSLFKKKEDISIDDNKNKRNEILKFKLQIYEIINKDLANDKFSLFEFDVVKAFFREAQDLNNYDAYLYMFNAIRGWNDSSNINRETGEYLNNLMKEKQGVLGIRRTNTGGFEYINGIPTNGELQDIMNNGVINNGHLSSGVVSDNPDLNLALSPFYSIDGIIFLVSSYKDNNSIILFQFPEEVVDKDLLFKIDPSDFYTSGDNCISPEYILGVLVKEENRITFYDKDQIMSVKDFSK